MQLLHLPAALRGLVAVGLLTSISHTLAKEAPSIHVTLQTAFSRPPYLVELLETASLEDSTSYFPLLDRIADGTFLDLTTDQQLYDKFIQVLQQDGHITQPEALSSFNFALSLHAAAPRIEAQYQYYNTTVEPSMMVAQDAACPVWVHLDGQQYCSPELERAQQSVNSDRLDTDLPFDHVLGSSAGVLSTLYADITHPLFAYFHETISKSAREGKTAYRVRYRPSNTDPEPLFVSGYGVELNLKRTDYIVIDDRDAEQTKGEQDNDDTSDLKPLTSSQVVKLGYRTGSYVMDSDDPISTLLDVSANFPRYSAEIASHETSKDFVREHVTNRKLFLPAGVNLLWMNGLQVQSRDMNAYTLLDLLRKERELMGRLGAIGLTPTEAVALLSQEVLAKSHADDQPYRFDWRLDSEDDRVVMWLNDIERDVQFAHWSRSLNLLLQRSYPGQLPELRRNVHHIILPIDFARADDLELVVSDIRTMVERGVPIRFGLVPIGDGADSKNAAKLSYYLLQTHGVEALLRFLYDLATSKKGTSSMKAAFESAVRSTGLHSEHEAHSQYDIVLGNETLSQLLVDAEAYAARLALGASSVLIANGAIIPRTGNWFEPVSQRIFVDHQVLQLDVYKGLVADEDDVAARFLVKAGKRRNPLIIPDDPKAVDVVNVAEIATDFADSFAELPRIPGGEAALLSDRAHLLLVLDLESAKGQKLLREVLDFLDIHPEVEVLILHNPSTDYVQSQFSVHLYEAIGHLGRDITREQLKNLLREEEKQKNTFTDAAQDRATTYWKSHGAFLYDSGFEPGESGIWLNGRVLPPLNDDFSAVDMETLLAFETQERIAPVTQAITASGLEEKFASPLDLAKVTSIVAKSLKSDIPEGIYESVPLIRIDRFKKWKNDHTMIHLPSESEPTIQLTAVIDPASEIAQNWLPVIKTLSELAGVDVKIYLNPRETMKELPVKRFYRNVIQSAPSFYSDGSLSTPGATFTNIPSSTLFNLDMEVPPAWLVSPKETIHDLENIKLSSLAPGQGIDALYQLDHILVEGHSREVPSRIPPRGVQLLLGTEHDPNHADTIIMANLGYFQFKANPGHWTISLKPGRSSRIFHIESIGSKGYEPQPGDEGTEITLMSFQGVTTFPRLRRRSGMEEEDVLEASASSSPLGAISDTASSLLSKGQSFLSSLGIGKKSVRSTTTTALARVAQADINIFSVASGHLYERMLSIMMLSVMRHTTHSVKFWFIEQFLSPAFKRALPHLAQHYNFRYELVTYKWPHWLRSQKEKQREIWGYKILFLDVLFPLDLDKVIFVDADQIVRTDMQELIDMDLHGAPYGFTPMCDSRVEMEGFRFWKQGYWAKFLEGKPYHISALYVVDLKRFRQLAAGDRLRGQYHALSADPASLSNLDQDLPNHMQHQLPIYSLPQNWLWCETWCSDASLREAKTIDLCNNPLTKEPKLERARRQVPEWNEYDEEIARVLKQAAQRQREDRLNQSAETDLEMELELVLKGDVQNQEQESQRVDRVKDEL